MFQYFGGQMKKSQPGMKDRAVVADAVEKAVAASDDEDVVSYLLSDIYIFFTVTIVFQS